jgi:hypothetical protein
MNQWIWSSIIVARRILVHIDTEQSIRALVQEIRIRNNKAREVTRYSFEQQWHYPNPSTECPATTAMVLISASQKGLRLQGFHMVRLNNEQIGSIFWLAVGVAIALGAASHGLGTPSSPEAGFMPFLAGVGMCLFASIGLVRATIQNKQGAGWRPILKEAAWSNSFIVLGALLFYVFLLPLSSSFAPCYSWDSYFDA